MQSPVAIVERMECDEKAELAIVQQARLCMESCNWRLGELACEWIRKTGKSDAEFGDRIGFSKKQIQQRRVVWETFGVGGNIASGNTGSRLNQECQEIRPLLTWSHFRAAVPWGIESFDFLKWAAESEATVKEMRCFRAAQNGEDLFALTGNEDAEMDRVDVESSAAPEPDLAEASQAVKGSDQKPGSGAATSDDSYPSGNQKRTQAAGQPRTQTSQPRSVDPAKFNVMEAVDRVRTTTLELAAEFVAAKRTDEFIHALRVVINELINSPSK